MWADKSTARAASLFRGNFLPGKLRDSERKPMVRSVNELKREARAAKKLKQTAQEVVLEAPANGLLVKELVPVARRVYAARANLFACVSRVAESVPIYSCSLCGEVHVGCPPHGIRSCDVRGSLPSKEHTWRRVGVEHVLPVVESFHLYDRIGRAVSHEEKLQVDRIPAVVELCVQAGVDIPEHPTRRRAFPVYNVSGRVIDFERRFPKEDSPGQDINAYGFWDRRQKFSTSESSRLQFQSLRAAAERGLKEWETLCTGAAKLMEKYPVQTCGYCSGVQVGPKGHRVRNCIAYKHQMRDGQHAWQEARTEDVIPPVYVWHVLREGNGVRKLENGLKRYYGKLPAAVELFSQAGGCVGERYSALMREDVVVPDEHEVNLVV
ncbi:hypothetical protein MLD38_017740 [Melastoma candidum]|uniref:Uncharacterized protein n=1 Tax=Melastoma candidum TaxID=119954 RepID=A0ACB9QTI8_9MYRT|nr:hypothetical protein MLD38_017740 [Melastoma candidum]